MNSERNKNWSFIHLQLTFNHEPFIKKERKTFPPLGDFQSYCAKLPFHKIAHEKLFSGRSPFLVLPISKTQEKCREMENVSRPLTTLISIHPQSLFYLLYLLKNLENIPIQFFTFILHVDILFLIYVWHLSLYSERFS